MTLMFGVLSFFLYSNFLTKFGQRAEAAAGLGSDDEVRLVKYLFQHKGYNALIRPVSNLSDIVEVSLGLAMVQLIHVEEKSQIMKSNVWLRMTWNDYQFVWDSADYGGIKVIRISPRKVWKPDIVLFNNADGKYEVSWQPNILINDNGNILWIPPAIYKSSCTINVLYFPFDQQQCEMKFGSWTFDATQVSLYWYEGNTNVDLSDYWKSGTWDIVDCPGKIHNASKPGQPPETQIVYTIFLRRKTLFYTVNLIIPCVLISLLSVCVFYLPADAGEKMTLCISILLALVVFLLLVSKILPPTSISIPLISKFLLFTFIMNIFTIVITVVIINWNFRTPRTHKMPGWVREVFMRYLPLILFMKRPEHIEQQERGKSYMRNMTKRCNGGLQDKTKQNLQSNLRHKVRVRKQSDSPTNLSDIQHQPTQSTFNFPSDSKTNLSPCPAELGTVNFWNPDVSSTLPLSSSGDYLTNAPLQREGRLGLVGPQPSTSSDFFEMSTLGDCLPPPIPPPAYPSDQFYEIGDSPLEPPYPYAEGADTMEDSNIFENSHLTEVISIGGDSFHHPHCRIGHQLSEELEDLPADVVDREETIHGQQQRQRKFPSTSANVPSNSKRSSARRRRRKQKPEVGDGGDDEDEEDLSYAGIKITPDMRRAITAINFISTHLKVENEYIRILQDWKYVASVIDRIQLIIFVSVVVAGTFGIIMNAPYILKFVDQDAVIKKFSE